MDERDEILRPSQAQAARMARRLGCSGAHEFNGSWMPCATHDELTRILDQINSLDDKDDECLPCSQGKSADRLIRKRRGRNPKRFEQLRERGVLGIDTLPDGSLVSGLQKSLTQWFKEQWVDISRPKKGGGFEPCGRDDADKGKYPKCVPAARARQMSAAEIRSAVTRKRRAESTETRVDKKPIYVPTKEKTADVVFEEKAAIPTNPELYARVKNEAKKKFDVYPSVYANAWLVREYKKRGGKYRSEKADDGDYEDFVEDLTEMQLSDLIDWVDQKEKAELTCPPATSSIAVNLRNRKKAIDTAMYGPLNPGEPNGEYWKKLASEWDVSTGEAKKQRCGNCAAFVKTERMLDCIDKGLGNESGNAAWDVIDAGDLGYCEAFDFKCASRRTCRAWIAGGPVTEERSVEEKSAPRRIRSTDPDVFMSADSARVRSRQLGCIGIRRYRTTDDSEAWMPCTNESDYRLRMGNSPLARRRNDERDKNFVRRVALAASKLSKKKSASPDSKTLLSQENRMGGLRRNRAGSAAMASGTGSVYLTETIVRSLSDKVKLHNDRMEKANNPAWSRANLRSVKSVYGRASGDFSRSHRPGITRNQWAMGRVNEFLGLLADGTPKSVSYVTDNDLLPESHPWKKQEKSLVQRVISPRIIDTLKGERNYWLELAGRFESSRIEEKAARRKSKKPGLRTIGAEIAQRGGALVDEDGMLRCPPTTLNGGQFTNWKLEGCNDPSGAVRVIAQRITPDGLASVPADRRITNSQASELARRTVVAPRFTEERGRYRSLSQKQDVFEKLNPFSRRQRRAEALQKFDKRVGGELSKRLGNRDLLTTTSDELDQIISMVDSKGRPMWRSSVMDKLIELRQEIDDLEPDIRSIQIMGSKTDDAYGVPRNIGITVPAKDIFDDKGELTEEGQRKVFEWLADTVDESTVSRDGSMGTIVTAIYDDATDEIAFDIVDLFDKSDFSEEAVKQVGRRRGTDGVLDMDKLHDREFDNAFINTGAEKTPSSFSPRPASTDVGVRIPRTTDPTGEIGRLAGQDKVAGNSYTPLQKAIMVNDLIDGVPGFKKFKKLPIHTDREYTRAELKQIDKVTDEVVQHMVDNMLRLLVNNADDVEFRARAKHWYPVANTYLAGIASDTGIHPSVMAAAAAAISPQLGWEANVSLAEHMARMIADKDFVVPDDVARAMAKEALLKFGDGSQAKKIQKQIQTLEKERARLRGRRARVSQAMRTEYDARLADINSQISSATKDLEFLSSINGADIDSVSQGLVGKKIENMSDLEVALAHRSHAMLHGMKYLTGEDAPLLKLDLNPDAATGQANPQFLKEATGMGYLSNDVKAIALIRNAESAAARAGEPGSREYTEMLTAYISASLGSESKVRSFYNNLNNPMDEYYRDITNDTWMGVAAFGVPAMAATTLRDGNPFNETDILFSSRAALGHGRGYALVSAAIMNVAKAWKEATGEDFTRHPRGMQSVLWELGRREWTNGSKMDALAASRELADLIAAGKTEFDIADRHIPMALVRLATYKKESLPEFGQPLVEFLKARGIEKSISDLQKMKVQDRIWEVLRVMKDSRGRPLFKGPIPIAQKAGGAGTEPTEAAE